MILSVKVADQKTPHHTYLKGTPDKGHWFCHFHPPSSIQSGQLNLLSLMLNLLGSGISLLSFSITTTKSPAPDEVWTPFGCCSQAKYSIFQLLASKDKSSLTWRNFFLIIDLSLLHFLLYRRFNLKGDGFPHQGFYKNLPLVQVGR